MGFAHTSASSARFADLIQETPGAFRIDPRIYDDPALFEAELERIFSNHWIYVGHESEVPDPGSFITSTVGLQPVIIVRGQDRQVRVFFNVCLHRGNTLCRERAGNTKAFVCRYHAWSYTTEGALNFITDPEAYSEEFLRNQSKLGLLAVRSGIYRGLIFANLSQSGESLDDYLGEIKPFIDLWADLAPAGSLKVHKPHAYSYRGNWKFQVENGVDLYHPPYVHRSGFSAFRRAGIGFAPQERRDQTTQEGATYGFEQGHCILQRPGLHLVYGPERYERYRAMLSERFGEERMKNIAVIRHIHIFPNVCLMDANIRVIQPLTVDSTNVLSYFTELDGLPEEFNILRLSDVQRRLGTVGLVGTDDIDIFSGSQTGIRARGFEQIIMDRGVASEVLLSNGVRRGGPTDETPQRAIYRGWVRTMTADVGAAQTVAL